MCDRSAHLLQQAFFACHDVVETLVLQPQPLAHLLQVLRLPRQLAHLALAHAQLRLRVLERVLGVQHARLQVREHLRRVARRERRAPVRRRRGCEGGRGRAEVRAELRGVRVCRVLLAFFRQRTRVSCKPCQTPDTLREPTAAFTDLLTRLGSLARRKQAMPVQTSRGDVRLSVRVGLGARFPDAVGIPSRIPFSSPNDDRRSSRRGSGRLDSGPARPWRTSKLLRCCNLGVKDEECPGEEFRSRSVGERGGEFKSPGGSGRGPRSIVLSRVCSWACWCRIECLSVDICVRMATGGTTQWEDSKGRRRRTCLVGQGHDGACGPSVGAHGAA